MEKPIRFIAIALFLVVCGLIATVVLSHSSSTTLVSGVSDQVLIQDEPQLALLPEALERISWSAVIAGTLLALILMFIFNLIGVALGLGQVHPERGKRSADGQDLAIGAVAWVAVSNLLALFAGGWLAAYFAGIPETTDGLLHGVMVWAVTGVITSILVASGIGRAMNGLASMISSGLNLTGSLASGAGQVASGTLQTAGHAASGLGNLSAQALSVLANGVQSSAQIVGNGISNTTDTAIENSPDVQNALSYQDLSMDEIRMEAERLMQQAGEDPQKIQGQVEAAVDDVQNAAQQIARHPERTGDILNIAIQRVFRRGEAVASDVDRDSLINLLMERTDMTREQAVEQINTWEERFNQVKDQTRQAREIARQRAEEFRQQAEQRAREVYEEAQSRVKELQHEAQERLREAEEEAREAAEKATSTFSKLAAGIAAAMIIGAVAAGLGGSIGAPEDLPDVDVEDVTDTRFEDTSFMTEETGF